MTDIELALMRLRRLHKLRELHAPRVVVEHECALVEEAFLALEAAGILEVALRFADSPSAPADLQEADLAVA